MLSKICLLFEDILPHKIQDRTLNFASEISTPGSSNDRQVGITEVMKLMTTQVKWSLVA
jgi:hypothetical protein